MSYLLDEVESCEICQSNVGLENLEECPMCGRLYCVSCAGGGDPPLCYECMDNEAEAEYV